MVVDLCGVRQGTQFLEPTLIKPGALNHGNRQALGEGTAREPRRGSHLSPWGSEIHHPTAFAEILFLFLPRRTRSVEHNPGSDRGVETLDSAAHGNGESLRRAAEECR